MYDLSVPKHGGVPNHIELWMTLPGNSRCESWVLVDSGLPLFGRFRGCDGGAVLTDVCGRKSSITYLYINTFSTPAGTSWVNRRFTSNDRWCRKHLYVL